MCHVTDFFMLEETVSKIQFKNLKICQPGSKVTFMLNSLDIPQQEKY